MQRAENEGIDEKQSFNGAPDTTTKSKLADIKSLVRTALSQKLTYFFPTLHKKSTQNKRRENVISHTPIYRVKITLENTDE